MSLRILSLGAGVQSTTLALMAAHGEIDPIDHAIFADTQSEPLAVYDHLNAARKEKPQGNLFGNECEGICGV